MIQPDKKRVYIAGPMRHITDSNRSAFVEATELFRARGYDVISPQEMEIQWAETHSHRSHCIRDISALSLCDTIYLLKGWKLSTGALAEHACAKWMELKIIKQLETK